MMKIELKCSKERDVRLNLVINEEKSQTQVVKQKGEIHFHAECQSKECRAVYLNLKINQHNNEKTI